MPRPVGVPAVDCLRDRSEFHATRFQVIRHRYWVAQAAAQPVELPHCERPWTVVGRLRGPPVAAIGCTIVHSDSVRMGSSKSCGQCSKTWNPIRRRRSGVGRRTRHHLAGSRSGRRTVGHDWNGRIGTDLDRRVCVASQHRPGHLGSSGHRKRTRAVSGEHMRQEYDFSKGKRGAVVPVPQGKAR